MSLPPDVTIHIPHHLRFVLEKGELQVQMICPWEGRPREERHRADCCVYFDGATSSKQMCVLDFELGEVGKHEFLWDFVDPSKMDDPEAVYVVAGDVLIDYAITHGFSDDPPEIAWWPLQPPLPVAPRDLPSLVREALRGSPVVPPGFDIESVVMLLPVNWMVDVVKAPDGQR